MEENNIEKKIKKQFDLIRQQLNNFKKAFETKDIKHNNFVPYLQTLHNVFDLNNSYGEDYFEFISKKQLVFLFGNNRILMKDICTKLKSLSVYLQKQKTNPKPQQGGGICKICCSHIESRNIEQAKNNVEDMGLNSLKKMFRKMQEQNKIALFTPDEDTEFFRELNRVLMKKQQILSITDNHLQNYLEDIMKDLKEIKQLQDLRDTTFTLPQFVNWQSKIKGQISSVLLNSFKGKVPIWIEKTFDYFVKIYIKLNRQFRESKSCQTDPYTQAEVLELRRQIDSFSHQQKVSKAINQDYIKQISQITEKIKQLQIQHTVLKEIAYMKDKSINRISVSNPKQFRSLRNSSLKRQSIITQSAQNNSAHKKSNFKPILKELKEDQGEKMQQIIEQKQSFGSEERKQFSKTQHTDSVMEQIRPVRRKNKRLTDIEYFKKMKMSQLNQRFLPNIKKTLMKDTEDQLSKLNKIKKTSILSDFYIKITKNDQKLQSLSYERKNQHQITQLSKSIIEVEQNKENQTYPSQLNQSESQRKIRIKKYKEAVSDVHSQMEQKIKNLQGLKKTYELKKKNSSLSTKSNNIKFYPSESPKNSNLLTGIQPFNLNKKSRHSESIYTAQKTHNQSALYLKNQAVQTQNLQNGTIRQIKSSRTIQKSIQNEKISKFFSNGSSDNPKSQFINIQVQTEKSHLGLVKRFEKNENIGNLTDEHFEMIMNKLLSNSPVDQSNQKLQTKRSKNNFQKNQNNEVFSNNCKANKSLYEKKRQENPKSSLQKYKQKSIQEPVQNRESHTKRSPKTCVFSKKDFSLFLSEQNSYKYETNLKKKYHKTAFCQLQEEQSNYLKSLYGMIELTKNKTPDVYSQIVSFIKYPYQTVINNFGIVNIVKQMSLEGFLGYMARIQYYHSKCQVNREDKKPLCDHVQKFIDKITNILVDSIQEQVSIQNESSKLLTV